MKKIAVIGGGASGMTAALFAAGTKTSVTLFEKQKKTGRKILASGNGRCNISNTDIDPSFYHGHNPGFVNNVFGRFGLIETRDFFSLIGVPLVEEARGRLFPASLQASTVVEMLEYAMHRRGVEILLHRRVERIIPSSKGLKIETAGREEHLFDAVILAAGSCAWPSLGASRSGYDLAVSLGHRVYDPFPAILPLTVTPRALHRLEGIKWDCRLRVLMDRKTIAVSEGELLFTRYGISGPAALDVSRAVNGLITQGTIPGVSLDFFPELGADELRHVLDDLWNDGEKPLSLSLRGILKKRMPEVLLGIWNIDPHSNVKALTPTMRETITTGLKSLDLMPGDPRSFDEAVVAAGGVDVNEINPVTMESKIVKNLFITGELLDIDGDSGGYNLQFAWSTGALAGLSASEHGGKTGK